MKQLQRKVSRLTPVIEERQVVFDNENGQLLAVRKRKIETVAEMKQKQREYMEGVHRLNNERTSADRLMLEALEGGLDTVKRQWMELYQAVLACEREETLQFERMSKAHRDLEAIKHLQDKYQRELIRSMDRQDQNMMDELAIRKFSMG